MEGTEGLTSNIRDVVRQASANPGTVFEVEKMLAERVCEEGGLSQGSWLVDNPVRWVTLIGGPK